MCICDCHYGMLYSRHPYVCNENELQTTTTVHPYSAIDVWSFLHLHSGVATHCFFSVHSFIKSCEQSRGCGAIVYLIRLGHHLYIGWYFFRLTSQMSLGPLLNNDHVFYVRILFGCINWNGDEG